MITMKTKDPNDIREWLKGRNRDTIRIFSNPFHRSVLFVDGEDYIACDIRAFIIDRKLYKMYRRLDKTNKYQPEGGAMFSDWIRMIS